MADEFERNLARLEQMVVEALTADQSRRKRMTTRMRERMERQEALLTQLREFRNIEEEWTFQRLLGRHESVGSAIFELERL